MGKVTPHQGSSFHAFATNDAFDANIFHQAGHRAARNVKALLGHLVPDFAYSIDLELLLKDPFNPGFELPITLGAQPIFAEIERIADPAAAMLPLAIQNHRTARSPASGVYLFVVLFMMLHPTHELEPPANPARFSIHADDHKWHMFTESQLEFIAGQADEAEGMWRKYFEENPNE